MFTDTVETHTLLVPQTSLYTSVTTWDGDFSVDQNYPDMSAMFIVTVFSAPTAINYSILKTRFYQLKKHEESVHNQTKPKVEIKKSAKTLPKQLQSGHHPH